MKFVTPEVYLLQKPQLTLEGVEGFLSDSHGGVDWFGNRYMTHDVPEHEILLELAGRLCYDSFSADGGNPNVTKVRQDRVAYLENLLKSGHTSVLEHASFTFGMKNVSRVMTHELVRHRVGTAISQESGRYVRPTELVVVDSPEAQTLSPEYRMIEEMYLDAVNRYDWDTMKFSEKKKLTSELRRMLPEGQATRLVWTGNLRSLRHVIELRTSPHAEWEIQFVFSRVLDIMLEQSVDLFRDLR